MTPTEKAECERHAEKIYGVPQTGEEWELAMLRNCNAEQAKMIQEQRAEIERLRGEILRMHDHMKTMRKRAGGALYDNGGAPMQRMLLAIKDIEHGCP